MSPGLPRQPLPPLRQKRASGQKLYVRGVTVRLDRNADESNKYVNGRIAQGIHYLAAPAGPSATAEGPGQRGGAENTDMQTAGPSGVGADTGRAVVEAEQGEEEASKTDKAARAVYSVSEI
ncbi:hypothetical protein SKAU_G00283550 [Synaphobranchus kaupii]|uniref:Uncharacterized protein n=1 Tax=Synaphobranchus kaupii TaxID=118154 RepID=A0A9Q1EXI3_SYNKA|nr:hypothetical protein SKAU_G00283550 [Synaphobranchus kaupii]